MSLWLASSLRNSKGQTGQTGPTGDLTSIWDGLSPHLIAEFYEVRRAGQEREGYWEKTDSVSVMAPLIDSNLEMVLNWQSPFEQAGPETRAPAVFALLQSGMLQPMIDAVFPSLKGKNKSTSDNSFGNLDSGQLRQFEGRTGITKLNSTQVFSGMPPVKITVTALFRAWSNSAKEVEAPFNQLMQWALPIHLDPDSTLLSRGAEFLRGSIGAIDALLPSVSPTKIGLKYKGRTFAPLVIESIGMPLNSPVDSNGRFVQLEVPMTLCTLTALDRQDWVRATDGSGFPVSWV